MANDPSCVALGLKAWKTQIDRADKLLGGLSSEERFCGKSHLAGIECFTSGDI
jgi:hypothetical protein